MIIRSIESKVNKNIKNIYSLFKSCFALNFSNLSFIITI